MVDIKTSDDEKNITAPKPETAPGVLNVESPEVGGQEVEKPQEAQMPDETANLRQQIEEIPTAIAPKAGAAANVNVTAQPETLNTLLEIAKKKGVVEAVAAAKKMNDPYALDALHDALAKEGTYKKFKK